MSLKEDLDDLDRDTNPHRRGKRFEIFLANMLQEEGFKVTFNPKAAAPRQTDLSARREQLCFLVEAKWLRRSVHIGQISAVRERLRKLPSDVFACVFSMSGYSTTVVEDVSRERRHEIILFDGPELRAIIADEVSFQELLACKREKLRTGAHTFFYERCGPSQDMLRLRSGPDTIRLGGQTKNWLLSATADNDIVFTNELLDFTGRHRKSVLSLDLNLNIRTVDDLQRFFRLVKTKIGLAGQGSFAIHQRAVGWYGFGFETFILAVKDQKPRYDELNWDSYHHSEELAYLERLDNGGLMCLSLRGSVCEGVYLHSSRVEMYFSGLPVDMSGIHGLCDLTDNREAKLEIVGENPVKIHRFHPKVRIEPIGTIVSDSDGRQYASGLIVKNPFLGRPIPPGEATSLGQPLEMLSNNDLLVCELQSWHNPDVRMDHYEIRYAEGCWIEHYPVLHVVCDWTD